MYNQEKSVEILSRLFIKTKFKVFDYDFDLVKTKTTFCSRVASRPKPSYRSLKCVFKVKNLTVWYMCPPRVTYKHIRIKSSKIQIKTHSDCLMKDTGRRSKSTTDDHRMLNTEQTIGVA